MNWWTKESQEVQDEVLRIRLWGERDKIATARHQELMETFGKLLAAVNTKNDLLGDILLRLDSLATGEQVATLAKDSAKRSDERFEHLERVETAYKEINNYRERADKLIPAKYLGWNWVKALVDMLEQRPGSRAVPGADASLSEPLGTCESQREGMEPHAKDTWCVNWKPLFTPAPPQEYMQVPMPDWRKTPHIYVCEDFDGQMGKCTICSLGRADLIHPAAIAKVTSTQVTIPHVEAEKSRIKPQSVPPPRRKKEKRK